MYTVSADFITAARAQARHILVRAQISDTWLAANDIISMAVTEAVNSSDGISMGATIASKLTMTIKMPDTRMALSGSKVRPEVALDGVNEWVPLGDFYITEAHSKDDFQTTFDITAYDTFSKTDVPYNPQIAMPNTATAILGDIAAQCGFSIGVLPEVLDGVLVCQDPPTLDASGTLAFPCEAHAESGILAVGVPFITPPGEFELLDLTCRQYIGYFAGLLGRNARFDRDGMLTFVWYKDNGCSIPRSLQYLNGCKRLTDQDFVVRSLTSGTSEQSMTAGSGVGISFDNPFMTQETLDGIMANIGTVTYTPMQVKWRGNPAVEAGDIVQVEDHNGSLRTVYVMEQTLRIGGGMHSEINCYGASDAEIAFSTSPTTKKLQRVYTQLNQAIKDATTLLNGANGGVFEIVDENGDGVNDGWLIRSPDRQKFIKATQDGIGITTDGGATYKEAMTVNGINASAITVGSLSAERIAVENYDDNDPTKLTDYIHFGDGTITLGKGDSSIILKLENNQIAFYNASGTRLGCFTNNSFEIENLENGQIRFQNFGFIPRPSGNLSFTKLK